MYFKRRPRVNAATISGDGPRLVERFVVRYGLVFSVMCYVATGGMATIPSLIDRRNVFYKHRDANFFPTASYVLADCLIDWPLTAAEILLYSNLCYWAAGLEPSGFFMFFLVLFALTARRRRLEARRSRGVAGGDAPAPGASLDQGEAFAVRDAAARSSRRRLDAAAMPRRRHAAATPRRHRRHAATPPRRRRRTAGVHDADLQLRGGVRADEPRGRPLRRHADDSPHHVFRFRHHARGLAGLLEVVLLGVARDVGVSRPCAELFVRRRADVSRGVGDFEASSRRRYRAIMINEYTSGDYKTKSKYVVALGCDADLSDGECFLKLNDYQTDTSWIATGLVVCVLYTLALTVAQAVALELIRFQNAGSGSQSSSENDEVPEATLDVERGSVDHKMYVEELQTNVRQSCAAGADDLALPFEPMCLAFRDVHYYVPIPGRAGHDEDELELLAGITAHAKPYTMTALMGSSGAGKTTLLDVLAGRKNVGRVTGDIALAGRPKNQALWNRVSGFVEQLDVHSSARPRGGRFGSERNSRQESPRSAPAPRGASIGYHAQAGHDGRGGRALLRQPTPAARDGPRGPSGSSPGVASTLQRGRRRSMPTSRARRFREDGGSLDAAKFSPRRDSSRHGSRLELLGSCPQAMSTRRKFVAGLLQLLEMDKLAGALVGSLELGGLTFEQRKRLTMAVEMAANPSVLFLDEPTSGLDSRAALVVIRAVQNITRAPGREPNWFGDVFACGGGVSEHSWRRFEAERFPRRRTGRTVVCTIHQPSYALFSEFSRLLLLRKGGETVYFGELGIDSESLISYLSGAATALRARLPPLEDGENPATWMLAAASDVSVDFAAYSTAGVRNLPPSRRGDARLRCFLRRWTAGGALVFRRGRSDGDRASSPRRYYRESEVAFSNLEEVAAEIDASFEDEPENPLLESIREEGDIELAQTPKRTQRKELDAEFYKLYASTDWEQFVILLSRLSKVYWRSPNYNMARLGVSVQIACIFGSCYMGKVKEARDADARLGLFFISTFFMGIVFMMSGMPVVTAERKAHARPRVTFALSFTRTFHRREREQQPYGREMMRVARYYRERSGSMYKPFPFSMAFCIVEIPYVLVSCLAFVGVLWAWVDMFGNWTQFLWSGKPASPFVSSPPPPDVSLRTDPRGADPPPAVRSARAPAASPRALPRRAATLLAPGTTRSTRCT